MFITEIASPHVFLWFFVGFFIFYSSISEACLPPVCSFNKVSHGKYCWFHRCSDPTADFLDCAVCQGDMKVCTTFQPCKEPSSNVLTHHPKGVQYLPPKGPQTCIMFSSQKPEWGGPNIYGCVALNQLVELSKILPHSYCYHCRPSNCNKAIANPPNAKICGNFHIDVNEV